MPTTRYTGAAPTTIAVTGATGLIGSALVRRLRSRGHTVRRLVRSARGQQAGDVVWDPSGGTLDPAALAGLHAVIHLAGEPVAQRWSPARKAAIRDSRVQGTTAIAAAIATMDAPPPVFLSGSAVGYYGDRQDELLDEGSRPGTDFLARVTQEWERATLPASRAGARVVLMRTGVVLDPAGGALARLLPPFRLGVGGPVGSGRQWMSWIGLEDQLAAIECALWSDTLQGPVNYVSPNPVTNAEFATTLGRVLARPAVIPVPRLALQLLYGEMADATLLASQRAMPRALVAAGYEFEYPTLEQALRAALR
ncbi:MAG: NAD-dependent epimerase/dehydratase [Gemmatimonadetes bacterium]|jgi:uncharacterized protein (TIGR01777 family)|nr:NAD-dependent epimerase/dehydratase [Gemmatimonadota bacterium]